MGYPKSLQDRVDDAFETAQQAGWWPADKLEAIRSGDVNSVLAQLCLITTEVSEAAEDVRVGKMTTVNREDGKPEGFPSELADVVIRVFQLAGAIGINLEQEVISKTHYNQTRSHRHGGKAI